MTEKKDSLYELRKSIFDIIEVGGKETWISRSYDVLSAVAIIVNLVVTFMYTFDDMRAAHGSLLLSIEAVTIAFFCIDYVLRLWTASFNYPNKPPVRAFFKYVLSFTGLVDLLSFLPYYLPVFFPAGAVAFRMFRVVRIFKLVRINAYHDSLSVISEVLSSKRQQLFSSVFIILILTLASSLCMYSVESEAQPDVFTNAFSGIWWSVMTILTVGYGEIYPITTLGKLLACGIMSAYTMQTLSYVVSNLGIFICAPLPLPFIAHGNTALVINFAMAGMLLSLFRTDGLYTDAPSGKAKRLRIRFEWE